jgi:hypothetical protein
MSKALDYIDILKFYGEKKQIDKLAEEQAELQHALRCNDKANILEEIADNLVLMRQFHALHKWDEDMVDAMGDEYKIAVELRGSFNELVDELIMYQAKLQHSLRGRDRFMIFMHSGQVKNLLQIIAKRNDFLPGTVEELVEEKLKRTSDQILKLRESELNGVNSGQALSPHPEEKCLALSPGVPDQPSEATVINISINSPGDVDKLLEILEEKLVEKAISASRGGSK